MVKDKMETAQKTDHTFAGWSFEVVIREVQVITKKPLRSPLRRDLLYVWLQMLGMNPDN